MSSLDTPETTGTRGAKKGITHSSTSRGRTPRSLFASTGSSCGAGVNRLRLANVPERVASASPDPAGWRVSLLSTSGGSEVGGEGPWLSLRRFRPRSSAWSSMQLPGELLCSLRSATGDGDLPFEGVELISRSKIDGEWRGSGDLLLLPLLMLPSLGFAVSQLRLMPGMGICCCCWPGEECRKESCEGLPESLLHMGEVRRPTQVMRLLLAAAASKPGLAVFAAAIALTMAVSTALLPSLLLRWVSDVMDEEPDVGRFERRLCASRRVLICELKGA